jgi:mRNA interferase MazF
MHVQVDSDETGLSGGSTVLLEQIQTVDIGRLGRRTGMLGPTTMERVDEAIRHSLGLFCQAIRSSS